MQRALLVSCSRRRGIRAVFLCSRELTPISNLLMQRALLVNRSRMRGGALGLSLYVSLKSSLYFRGLSPISNLLKVPCAPK